MILDELLISDGDYLPSLTLEEKTNKGVLPEELSIYSIAKICYPGDAKHIKATINLLVKACKSEDLKCYGNINGWEYGGLENRIENPFPRIEGTQKQYASPMLTACMSRWICFPEDCLIHRNDFRDYLQSKNQWPIDGLLNNWYINFNDNESSPQIELDNDILEKEINTANNFDSNKYFHSVIKRWLFDLWVEKGEPKTGDFFRILKKQIGAKGSLIIDHWGAGCKDGGFRWKVGNSEKDWTYKNLGNIVAREFKKSVKTQN